MFEAVTALRDAGRETFQPGDVTAHLRDKGTPYDAWEVRGELARLEGMGLIELDPETARWHLVNGASFSIEAAIDGHRSA